MIRMSLSLGLGALALSLLVGRAVAQEAVVPDPVPPILAQQLKHKEVEVRRAAAYALKYFPSSGGVVSDLVAALGDQDEVVRNNAADAIVLMTPKTAVTALSGALKDRNPVVRRLAAQSLGRIRRFVEEAIPELNLALADKVPEVREAAAETLKKINGSRREY